MLDRASMIQVASRLASSFLGYPSPRELVIGFVFPGSVLPRRDRLASSFPPPRFPGRPGVRKGLPLTDIAGVTKVPGRPSADSIERSRRPALGAERDTMV